MGFVVFGPCLLLVMALDKKLKGKLSGRPGDILAIVMIALSFIAGCGMAYTFLGTWYAALVGLLAKIPAVGAAIPLMLFFSLAVTLVVDVWQDREADRAAQIAAVLMPTTIFTILAGTIGQAGDQAVPAVMNYTSNFLTSLGG